MTGITTYLSILTLNVNGLNSPIKRHHLANWIKKEDSTICCLQETHLIDRNKHWLRMKGWKKIYQANGPWKHAGVAIHISDKVDFKLTLIKRDKEKHSPNVSAPNFNKHILNNLKEHTDSNTVLVGDFNTPPSPVGHPNKKTIKKL
jgi:mRNA deadenylase 3'-5' endonuclease subunit Ccr4